MNDKIEKSHFERSPVKRGEAKKKVLPTLPAQAGEGRQVLISRL